jgi:Holliday junction resolvase
MKQRNFILAKKRTGRYCREKGNAYERKLANELTELGFDVVTSRAESKNMDQNKVDLIDRSGKLPLNIQVKRTKATPSYFTIRSESTVNPISFCII